MKVLLVNKFYFPHGGSETYLFQVEALLKKKGHSVSVFSTRDPRNKPCPEARFFVEKVDYNRRDISFERKVRFGARLLYSFDAAKKMDALLREVKPDIAHLHNICHQISPSILPVLKRHGVPIVQTLHDFKLICPSYRMLSPEGICERCHGGRYYNVIRQRCVKGSLAFSLLLCLEAYLHRAIRSYDRVDLFIASSQFYRDKLVSFGVDGRRIRVLPNFVQPDEEPSCEEARGSTPSCRAPNHPQDAHATGYALYCGRLGSEKGVLTLVKAAEGAPNLRVVIAGSGSEEAVVRQYLNAKRVRNVELAGFVSGDAKKELIRGAAFFVVPSEWYENCSLSIHEAFAYGKPVVGARIGGIPEQVKPGYNGLLFEPGYATDLREKMLYLVSHRDALLEMARNARKTADEVYAPEMLYDKLLQIYREAMEQKPELRTPRERPCKEREVVR